MYLSNHERLKLLGVHLVSRPFDFFRYLRFCLFSDSPLRQGLPWWSFDAIDWVRKNHKRLNDAFEWGSGGSTIFLGKLCGSLYSIENNSTWLSKVGDKIAELELRNVRIELKGIDLSTPNGFKNSEYHSSLSKKYDLIVIDGEDHFGPESKWSAREICFEKAEHHIREHGAIIVDDSWRYPKIREISKAKEIMIFQGIGPCRRGVTSTDIHIY